MSLIRSKQSSSSTPLLPPSSSAPSLLEKSVSPRAREPHHVVNSCSGSIPTSSNGKQVGSIMKNSTSIDSKMSDAAGEEIKVDRSAYDNACTIVTHIYNMADERLPDHTKKLDQQAADVARSSLLFGEVSQDGVDKILDEAHLNAANATTLYDLGSGNGKLAMQAFLQYSNLKKVVGVEIAVTRAIRSFAAVSRLASYYSSRYSCENFEDSGKLRSMVVDRSNSEHLMKVRTCIVTELVKSGSNNGIRSTRSLEMRRMSLFDCDDALSADIIICETEICTSMWSPLAQFLTKMKAGARLLTYENIEHMFSQCRLAFPFERICAGDRYFTSWAPTNGHAFHLWRRI